MKVVLLNPIGQVGGAERVLLAVLSSLIARFPGVEVTVVTLNAGPLLDEAKRLGAQVVSLEAPDRINSIGESRSILKAVAGVALASPHLLHLASRLSRLIKSLQPDVVHSFGLKTHLLLAWARPRRTRVIWHVQDFYRQRAISRALCPVASHRADQVVAISRPVADDIRLLLGKTPVTCIENAINTSYFTKAGETIDLDAAAGAHHAVDGTVKIGLVATYARWKGHRTFLEAASIALTTSKRPLRFYVVGGPIYSTSGQFSQQELEGLAQRLGIADSVAFVPFQDDPSAVYRSLDIVVHASTSPEPFGLVIVEAMSCGRAVVVSDAGGASDIFTDGIDAIGHPPGNVDELASAIGRLARDRATRERLGESGVKTARNRFGLERYSEEIATVYRQVTTGPR